MSLLADDVHVDLALPAALPVAALLPQIADILAAQHGYHDDSAGVRFQLSRPGEPALNESQTLAQQHIYDGTVLMLSTTATELPAPAFSDVADAVSTSLSAATPRTWRAAALIGALTSISLGCVGVLAVARTAFTVNDVRHSGAVVVVAVAGCSAIMAAAVAQRGFHDRLAGLTFGLLAIGFMALSGLLAVPGSPGAPTALLAAAATAVTAVVMMHVLDCGRTLFRAIGCSAGITAVAALAAAAFNLPLRAIGAMSVVISLVLLEASARLAVLLAGLSPRLGTDDELPDRLLDKAIQTDNWLTSLVASFSTSAALGGIGVALTAYRAAGPTLVGIAFATLTGALLLARARVQNGVIRMTALTATGTSVLSASFVAVATTYATHPVWVTAGAAILPAVPLCMKFLAPIVKFSPVALRGAELTECLALAALVPLACWICGFYGAVRGLHLP